MVEPWRSIVHWPELYTNRVHYESRTELETYVPVTCGNCRVKRPTRVVRGLSADLLSADSLSSRKGKVFTGLCRVCTNLLREYSHKTDTTEDEKIPSGSIIHWTERERSRGVPVTCGRCGKKRFMLSPNPKVVTGLCDPCSRRKHVSDERLPSGSVVHWSERDPDNPSRTMITCGGCGLKRYAFPNETGLCFPCSRPRRSDDCKLPSGSIIHFSERALGERKRAMVTCGQCGAKHEMWVGDRFRRTIIGFCPTCTQRAGTKNLCESGVESEQ
jgi:hypothetical protein